VKAIILAAGRGSRMKHFTRDLPKCLAIVLGNRSLLDRQLEVLRSCRIQDIVIVRGYQARKINRPGVRYYLNRDYMNNNIMDSLFSAEPELEGDGLVSYSDIWYEKEVLEGLLGSKGDIVIGVDIHWQKHYRGRKDHPIEEAERVVWDSRRRVMRIGKFASAAEETHGEFIGLMKLTSDGCAALRQHYHRAKSLYEGKPFQRSKLFRQAYLTDLLQEMADRGVRIQGHAIRGVWREIDTVEDFDNAVREFDAYSQSLRAP